MPAVRMPAVRRVVNAFALVVTLGASALANPAGAATATAAPRHLLGLIPQRPAATVSSLELHRRVHALADPARVDLTADAPPAGDQGQVASCVSWAIDYSLLGWYLHHDGRTGRPLAPMYTYAQLVHGQNVGTYFGDTFDIAQVQGVDTRSHYTQGDYNYTTQPTVSEKANASHWRITGYDALPIGGDAATTKGAIEDALASGSPVVLGIPVYYNFFGLSSGHSDYAGPSGTFEGGHAVTAFGYDRYGVTIENSWGSWWGTNGFARLSWSFIDDYAYEGYTIQGLADGPDVSSAAPRYGTIAGGATVTLKGVGLGGATAVHFGTAAGTDIAVNDAGTQLTVTTPARAAGLVNITVTTDAGTSAAGLQAQYRYENSPTISAVSVRAGSIKGGTQVNFTGTNLYGAAVKFGGVAQTISVNSAGTVATIATHARAAGAYAISIVTPVGTIAAGTFTYVAPPTVSSLSVRTGTYTGGTGVWVSGARLDGARITIGGKVAKVLATGTTRVLIATPAGTVGVHGIVVVQTVGGSVNSGLFTWVR